MPLRFILAMVAIVATCAFPHAPTFANSGIQENAETPYLAHDFIFVDSPEIETYLRDVSQRLLAAKDIKMPVPNILLQSSDSFTVFTDANRNLIVSTGALRAIESEDELAAVLGHELSHQVLKHPQNKDALSVLPAGLDLTNAQNANLLWGDFLAPSWNRKQERAADEQGFEMMRAAGYDPSAFGTLFQKLHAAEAKRSERLDALRKTLSARARTSESKLQAGSFAGVTRNVADTASDKLVDSLSSFNREYDSPDERQAALAAYASEHRLKKRVPAPEKKWQSVIQGGAGANLLKLDADAIDTLAAIAAKNATAATQSVASLGDGDVKQPSAHLNLAVGTYFETKGKRDIGERSAQGWLEAPHAPAQAYMWSASYEAARGNYAGAIEILESGRRRVGASVPFLPNLVSLAVQAGNRPLAERYAQECAAEDRPAAGATLKTMLNASAPAPTGLHAECLRRLGYTPAPPASNGGAAQAALTSKFKNLLKR